MLDILMPSRNIKISMAFKVYINSLIAFLL